MCIRDSYGLVSFFSWCVLGQSRINASGKWSAPHMSNSGRMAEKVQACQWKVACLHITDISYSFLLLIIKNLFIAWKTYPWINQPQFFPLYSKVVTALYLRCWKCNKGSLPLSPKRAKDWLVDEHNFSYEAELSLQKFQWRHWLTVCRWSQRMTRVPWFGLAHRYFFLTTLESKFKKLCANYPYMTCPKE